MWLLKDLHTCNTLSLLVLTKKNDNIKNCVFIYPKIYKKEYDT